MVNLLFAQAESLPSGLKAIGSWGDVAVFFLFLAAVIFVAFGMSRKSADSSEDYFLAGRGLKWWLIGFSLIAANISAEQFVGMSGQGADYIGFRAFARYCRFLLLTAFFKSWNLYDS